ncbi:transmembrane protein 104-like, partial [Ruditapes philippinarum]|uniref:transmembrane protein 104-like n=1 Tax=Ruditapes philippinarum TaxID=129788 RepID=UPI00295A858D
MAGDINEIGTQFSKSVGLIYIFNLIVGTGALTMPRAFEQAGWVLSLVIIIVLSFMSFMTVTFVTEAMGIANALLKKHNTHRTSVNAGAEDDDEVEPLLANGRHVNEEPPDANPFEISMRTELGHMAGLFFNKIGLFVFNVTIVIYLYGDLSIYAAAVPKSIRDISCTYKKNATYCANTSLTDSDPCWSNSSLTRMSMYRICVAGFFLSLGG